MFVQHIALAQPGPYAGALLFKVSCNGEIVDLDSKGWKVSPSQGDAFFKLITYTFPGYYTIHPRPGNGAILPANFHIEIVHFKDTMAVYMPSIDCQTVKIENIPFEKGIYRIPQHVYDVKTITDQNKAYTFTPAINGDWSLFRKKNHECYLEKVQDIETNYPYSDYGNNLSKLELMYRMELSGKNSHSSFYYFDNVIISTHDNKSHKIYLVKEISDTTFWGSKINDSKICFLYAQNHQIYAIAARSFGAFTPGIITEFGIFKLHFYDNPISNIEKEYLQIQLNKDTYKSLVKVDTMQYDKIKLIPSITKKYNKLNKKY